MRLFTAKNSDIRFNSIVMMSRRRCIMVARSSLKSQLARLNLHFWLFGRAEIKELHKILEPSEVVRHCAHGYYHGGSGLLVATNKRLILIDKRPLYLNLEEMKYELIHDIGFEQRFLQATLRIKYDAKSLIFRSASDARLKEIQQYVSEEISLSKRHFAREFTESKQAKFRKPYLSPAWSPHNPMLIRQRRPTKFYHPSRMATPR